MAKSKTLAQRRKASPVQCLRFSTVVAGKDMARSGSLAPVSDSETELSSDENGDSDQLNDQQQLARKLERQKRRRARNQRRYYRRYVHMHALERVSV
jgi:hypothetical protein